MTVYYWWKILIVFTEFVILCAFIEFSFEPKPAVNLAEDLGLLRTQWSLFSSFTNLVIYSRSVIYFHGSFLIFRITWNGWSSFTLNVDSRNIGLSTGPRTYYLKNDLAHLEEALVNYTLDVLRAKVLFWFPYFCFWSVIFLFWVWARDITRAQCLMCCMCDQAMFNVYFSHGSLDGWKLLIRHSAMEVLFSCMHMLQYFYSCYNEMALGWKYSECIMQDIYVKETDFLFSGELWCLFCLFFRISHWFLFQILFLPMLL